MKDDNLERKLHSEWNEAESLAQKKGDVTKLVGLLRRLHQPHEIPDLWFMADLIEGKFKRAKGRPIINKIEAGLKKRCAAEAVVFLMDRDSLSVEEAVELAAKPLGMSESDVKKSYYKLNKNEDLIKNSIFKPEIIKSFK